jgi:hypothetical protein
MQNIWISDIQTTLILIIQKSTRSKLKLYFQLYFSLLEKVFFQKMANCIFGSQRYQEFPDKEYEVPATGGYNLSSSKIIVLYVQLILTHEKFEFLGSEMVQNCL